MNYADPATQREYQRKYQREWMRRRRAEYLAGKTCAWCGDDGPLEVDHIDPAQKISHRIWSWSAERRTAELSKCQILCVDCHDVKTWNVDRGLRACGTTAKYRRGCRCADCRSANAEKTRLARARREVAA